MGQSRKISLNLTSVSRERRLARLFYNIHSPQLYCLKKNVACSFEV